MTTIVGSTLRKPFLEKWRGDVGNQQADKRRDEAGDHGKNVHAACGLVMKGIAAIPFDLSELHQEQVAAFERWHNLAVDEVLAVEETIYNDTYGYAGTLDERSILKGNKLPAIIDVKTGWYDENHNRMQTVAYRNGDGIVSGRRIIVDLKNLKAGMPTIHEFKDHTYDFQAFLWALGIFKWTRGVRN